MQPAQLTDGERHLERLLLRSMRENAEAHAAIETKLGELSGKVAAVRLLAAAIDQLTAEQTRLSELVGGLNQITAGVRSLGESGYDIGTALSRRMKILTTQFRLLVGRLVEARVIPESALQDVSLAEREETDSSERAPASASLRAVDAPRARDD